MQPPLRTTLVLAGLLLAIPAGAQPSSADLARADDLYRKGIAAYEAGQLQEARDHFQEAFALKPTFDIAGNLGTVELKLDQSDLAAEHLALSLRLFPVNGKENAKALTAKSLEEAKAKVGCFAVRVNADGAKIDVAGRRLGPTPLLDKVCFKPGDYTVSVSRDGYSTLIQALHVQAGADAPLAIELKKDADEGGGGAGGTEPGADKPLWPTLTLAIVGAAGLGAGIGLTVVSSQRHGDAEDIAATCQPVTSACEADGDAALTDANVFLGSGIAALSVGAAAGLGAVLYATLPGEPAKQAHVTPWLSPTLMGAAASFAF